MKNIFILISFFLFLNSAIGQKSVKLHKQNTKFYYGQLVLHGGYVSDLNGTKWTTSPRSPKNQLVFQVFSKNSRKIQRGYIKNMNWASWKLRVGLEYDHQTINGSQSSFLNFKLYDSFIKFSTKWTRTSISIGNKSIPYGHNPKIDPVGSFMINPIKYDLGFAQDIGLFFKTPISKKLDLEFALTSGGFLNKPFLVCNDLIINNNTGFEFKPKFSFGDYSYRNTWLATMRFGSPSYAKNEFGMTFVAGEIASTIAKGSNASISKIGIEWIGKYNERFKIVNQVVLGNANIDNGISYFTTNLVSNFDYYTGNHWMLSGSFSMNIYNDKSSYDKLSNHSFAGSLTYVVSPHTRIRLNAYYTVVTDNDELQRGVLLQFISGIGRRP